MAGRGGGVGSDFDAAGGCGDCIGSGAGTADASGSAISCVADGAARDAGCALLAIAALSEQKTAAPVRMNHPVCSNDRWNTTATAKRTKNARQLRSFFITNLDLEYTRT